MSSPRRVHLTKEQIARGKRMRQAGASWYEISQELDTGYWAVRATLDPEYRDAEFARSRANYAADPASYKERDRVRRSARKLRQPPAKGAGR